MQKKSLKGFDPNVVARLELEMWQAYYRHRFVKLFFLLVRLLRGFFSFSYTQAVRGAYYAAKAAARFRIVKGKENEVNLGQVLKDLTKSYRIVSRNTLESFDYKKVAQLELEWWLTDRYPDRYKTSREAAIALAMASLYSVEPSTLSDYAARRAEAMVLVDELEEAGDENMSWDKVANLLHASYGSLHDAVQ